MCPIPGALRPATDPHDPMTARQAALASLWFAPRRQLWPEVAGTRRAAAHAARATASAPPGRGY